MTVEQSIVLIGGTSHTGKSTLAHVIAARTGGQCISTDNLARHPGRPWRTDAGDVPAHVAAHYLSLTVSDLMQDVLRHYREVVRPLLIAAIDSPLNASRAVMIVEGSAVLPEMIDVLQARRVTSLWLTASHATIRQRIRASSRHATKSTRDQFLIDQFVQRACAFNDTVQEDVARRGLASVDTERASIMDDLINERLAALLSTR